MVNSMDKIIEKMLLQTGSTRRYSTQVEGPIVYYNIRIIATPTNTVHKLNGILIIIIYYCKGLRINIVLPS